MADDSTAAAIERCFETDNEKLHGEPANLVDAVFYVGKKLRDLGNGDAGMPMGAMEALGKAILDSAERIAGSIDNLAEAVRGRG